MKKRIFTLMAAVAVMVTAFSSVASAKVLNFTLYRSNGATQITTNQKDLTGNYWQITNSSERGDFKANSDVIGFRTWGTGGQSYSGYHTFSKFVYRYSLPYINTPNMKAGLSLNGLVDSTSARRTISYYGEWIS